MAGIKIEIDLSGVYERCSEENFNRGRFNMANRMLQTMNENHVPEDTTHLRDSGYVSGLGDQLVWDGPYAGPQYYGGRTNHITGAWIPFVNYTTPGTGPYWDEASKPIFINDWLQAFKKGARL